MWKRALEPGIRQDLNKKIILLSGPRQCGKTTLVRSLSNHFDYFNYDSANDRLKLARLEWNRESELVIFDELHKMKNWKRWLKGVYDKQGHAQKLIVTGSSRLDIAKKMGDSLAGRHFYYRLYPLDIHELRQQTDPTECLHRLMEFGGFPEPFSEADPGFYQKWSRSHLDLILRQDLLDIEQVRNISAMETVIEILRQSVGSTISYASIARQVERDPTTIKRWLALLENLHIVFRVLPYSRSIARSLLKEPKFYFYDIRQVAETSARFENLVAIGIRKNLHYLEDVEGKTAELFFLRNKEKKEIDFMVSLNRKPSFLIEAKLKTQDITPNFSVFQDQLGGLTCIQLTSDCESSFKNKKGHRLISAAQWFSQEKLFE